MIESDNGCYYNTIDAVSKEETDEIDAKKLLPYLIENIDEFDDYNPEYCTFSIRKFGSGFSNSPFLLTYINNKQNKKFQFVLRKCPEIQLASDQAPEKVLRKQFDIMSILYTKSDVPVPKTYLFCDDKSVIGQIFYVMEFVKGRILLHGAPHLPNVFTNQQRKEIYYDLAKVLAQIHSIDYNKIGLKNSLFSNMETWTIDGFCNRWTKSCQEAVNHKKNELFANKIDLLNKTLLSYINDNYVNLGNECMLHGDFHLENIIWHPTECKIIAMVDWENCYIGNPLMELSYGSQFWHSQYDPQKMSYKITDLPEMFQSGIKAREFYEVNGIPTEQQFVQKYLNHLSIYNRNNMMDMALILKDLNKNLNIYAAIHKWRVFGLFDEIHTHMPDHPVCKEFTAASLEFLVVAGLDVLQRPRMMFYKTNASIAKL